MLYCKSIGEGMYPQSWKVEFMNPIPKIFPPEQYSDLRNISLTEWISKGYENFLLNGSATVKGLLYYVRKYLDPNQFAVSKSSCTHALLKIIDFILKNTDKNSPPKAVLSLLADWSKAFNNCNHNIIIRILQTMLVPQWLIRILMSYLQNRKIIVRFRGKQSEAKAMDGGTTQGTLIGVILYILYINPIGFPSEITLNVNESLTKYWEEFKVPESIPLNDDKLPETLQSTKYMDDATIQEIIDIKTTLVSKIDRSGPLNFYESSGKILPKENSLLQGELEKIKQISDSREMKLNDKKTFLFISNFTKVHQFRPDLQIPGAQENLQIKFETKLLGYWLTTDLKPKIHIAYLLKIAYRRIWAIRRLKANGVSDNDIIFFYCLKIRSVLEFSCQIFQPMMTQTNRNDMERVQKIVLKITLGPKYSEYPAACEKFGISQLEEGESYYLSTLH